jgi:formate dehydrogenase major subunit
VLLVIGANPTDAHPVFASRMKRRLREGAKLIVADPRQIDLVSSPHVKAQHHLALRPGTNVALINSLAHVVVTEGLVAKDYVAKRCDDKSFNEWCEFVSKPENSPEAFESVTGVPAQPVPLPPVMLIAPVPALAENEDRLYHTKLRPKEMFKEIVPLEALVSNARV